jgi:hypothetical protein
MTCVAKNALTTLIKTINNIYFLVPTRSRSLKNVSYASCPESISYSTKIRQIGYMPGHGANPIST